jgi:hypothetical protein
LSIDFGGETSIGEELYSELLSWIAGLDVGNSLALATAIERRAPWATLSPNLRRELDDFAETILGGDEVS